MNAGNKRRSLASSSIMFLGKMVHQLSSAAAVHVRQELLRKTWPQARYNSQLWRGWWP